MRKTHLQSMSPHKSGQLTLRVERVKKYKKQICAVKITAPIHNDVSRAAVKQNIMMVM